MFSFMGGQLLFVSGGRARKSRKRRGARGPGPGRYFNYSTALCGVQRMFAAAFCNIFLNFLAGDKFSLYYLYKVRFLCHSGRACVPAAAAGGVFP